MLIIPAENTINWKQPPWMTLGLMLACLLVFLFYQGGDARLMSQAVERYLAADLLALEAPVYEDYLQREVGLHGESSRVYDLQAFQRARAGDERIAMAVTLLSDPEFYHYQQENRAILWPSAGRQQWLEQRTPIQDELIARLSAFELGLVPAELSPATLIAYQFLHGGWGHLIGNLVILFLLGFTVEKALGPGRYLLAYLLCGVVSGLVYSAFSLGSRVPLVGASGAISGLMGMYVAIYGAQRIRFFYFIGVYFNYFRAPALALLPVWLAKEIYDYWFAGATGIAYMAHAGGLVAGAVIILALGRSWLQVREAFFEPEQEALDEQFTSGYAQAMASLGRMEFAAARRQFQSLQERYPDRLVLREHLYQLAKLRPDQPDYRDQTRQLMAAALSGRRPERMVEVWQEYLAEGETHHPLAADDHSRILFACLRSGELKAAEKAFERLRGSEDRVLLEEAGHLMIEEFEKRQLGSKARHYRQLLEAH